MILLERGLSIVGRGSLEILPGRFLAAENCLHQAFRPWTAGGLVKNHAMRSARHDLQISGRSFAELVQQLHNEFVESTRKRIWHA